MMYNTNLAVSDIKRKKPTGDVGGVDVQGLQVLAGEEVDHGRKLELDRDGLLLFGLAPILQLFAGLRPLPEPCEERSRLHPVGQGAVVRSEASLVPILTISLKVITAMFTHIIKQFCAANNPVDIKYRAIPLWSAIEKSAY